MARSVPGTLDRRDMRDMSLDSCDMDTMPLTPASFGGMDHKVSKNFSFFENIIHSKKKIF